MVDCPVHGYRRTRCLLVLAVLAAAPISAAAEEGIATGSCDRFMAPAATSSMGRIGQERCLLQERIVTDTSWREVGAILGGEGRKYHRLDIGVTGTMSGYVVREGPRVVEFTSGPEFLFVQSGNKTTPMEAVVRYEAEKGTGVTLLYPEPAAQWNGKLYVTVHGTGKSFRNGSLKSWDKNFQSAKPLDDLSKFEKTMLVKGYAVAVTHRNSEMATPGDYTVKLKDDRTLEGKNASEAPELILDLTTLSRNILRERLGRAPSRTYWYGKSAGARLGMLLNFQNKKNLGADGKPLIDGLIADDSGAGLWLPTVVRDGKDVLFSTEAERSGFIPTIEVAHLLYNNERNDPAIAGVSQNFLANKRMRARMLREKGLTSRYRFYEVRGVSHSGGETLPDQKRGGVEIMPLWYLMEGFIDLLDRWVEGGVEPPADRSDWPALGHTTGDGLGDREAISLPEIACPLGTYFQFPPGRGMNGVGETGYAAFDGKDLEPFDGRTAAGSEEWYEMIAFADMNRNGSRDFRETVTEAWRRLGLIGHSEPFTPAAYAACVQKSVESLSKEGLIGAKVAEAYLQRARAPLPEWVR